MTTTETTTETTANGAVQLAFDEQTKIATLTLCLEGGVNKIDEVFGEGLTQAMKWASGRQELAGIIIASAHKDFCVGADIDMLYEQRDAAALYERVRELQQGYREIETCGVPVVAALTGSALGGGYELALACHHRVALNDPRIQLGLPEVTLGVIPGAGGTQRLCRMIGIQASLEVIAAGQLGIKRAPKARAAGLVDELCNDREELRRVAEAWIAANPKAQQPWDRKGFEFPPPRPGSEAARDLVLGICAFLNKRTAGAYLAPQIAVCAVQEGAGLSFDRALEVEARYFVQLAVGDQAKDMIRTLWYHKNAADKHEGLPSVEALGIEQGIDKIGILGAGMMGAALGFVCAKAGYQVVLKDIKQEQLDAAEAHCKKLAAKGARHLDATSRQALLDQIRYTLELDPLEGCDLIIEAVFEEIGLKHRVTEEIEPLLLEGGIWASNTSALPITELVAASAHPERFIGLHFFSPVEKMPLLEIICGDETDEQTLARCLAFCRQIKKTPIVVGDGYAFYTSRVFSSYLIEAVQLVAEGHEPALVEWAARSAGMVVGPLQVFDEVTLTLVRHALEGGKKYLGDVPDYAAGVALLRQLVDDHGRHGRAAGQGFYDYDKGKRQGIWSGLRELVTATPAETGLELIGQRLLLIQCVEAVRALEAGVLKRHRDADVGGIFGIGFAPNTGGPFSHLDRLGLKETVATLEAFAKSFGPRYTPPAHLEQMAHKGERFYDGDGFK
jgi:3-hydroxyacyl-CoA dehydrogenase / enoyl-CoA hydratase / 3-hydroxybutyryl-CoA epimerase